MKTKDPNKSLGKTLCTVWNGELFCPGTILETKEVANEVLGQFGDNLVGVEEWWLNSVLKKLPEYAD